MAGEEDGQQQQQQQQLVYRLGPGTPDTLRIVLDGLGWREEEDPSSAAEASAKAIADDNTFNLWWKGSRYRKSELASCRPWQRLNHFPNAVLITKKDKLVRKMRECRSAYGSAFSFVPEAFILPSDYTRFVKVYGHTEDEFKQQQQQQQQHQQLQEQQQQESDNSRASAATATRTAIEHQRKSLGKECAPASSAIAVPVPTTPRPAIWICKPADSSQGRGIFLFRDLSSLRYGETSVVQRYLDAPLLVDGYKLDLRLYVVVKSFRPLVAYMYRDGLARFSTQRYTLDDISNPYAHLTNTSINKYSPDVTSTKGSIGSGCKWELSRLHTHLRLTFGAAKTAVLWERIVNVVQLTLLAIAPDIPVSPGCFELYGFDILVDKGLKPWLLEVNFTPALGLDCPEDNAVKLPMLRDLVSLLGYSAGDSNRRSDCASGGMGGKSKAAARKSGSTAHRARVGSTTTTTAAADGRRMDRAAKSAAGTVLPSAIVPARRPISARGTAGKTTGRMRRVACGGGGRDTLVVAGGSGSSTSPAEEAAALDLVNPDRVGEFVRIWPCTQAAALATAATGKVDIRAAVREVATRLKSVRAHNRTPDGAGAAAAAAVPPPPANLWVPKETADA